jgi:hypothetical protein
MYRQFLAAPLKAGSVIICGSLCRFYITIALQCWFSSARVLRWSTRGLRRFADALADIGVMEVVELNGVTDEELVGVGMSAADIYLVRAEAGSEESEES